MREGWTYKKLGEVATFKRGLTYSGKDEVSFSDNVVLRSNNIDLATNTLNLDELKYVSSDISIPEDKKLKANSIFMCMSNGSKQHLGKVAFIDQDMPYAFGGFMGLIIPQKEKIYPKYLYFYFCSPQFKDVLSSIGNGANINNIKFVDIAKYSVKTPSLSEQQTIVAELDKINELISLKKAQLSDLDKLAQSIFYDMFGDPIENEKGWEVKLWSDVLTIINGRNQKSVECIGGEFPIYGSGGIMSYANNWLCPEDCIIIGRKGNINKPIFVHTKFWNVDTAFGLDAKRDVLSPIYLYYFCIDYDFERHNKAVTIPSLTKADLLKISIPLPPLPLQQEFAKRIELIEQQKAQISSTIKDLETLLASRMQYWFD